MTQEEIEAMLGEPGCEDNTVLEVKEVDDKILHKLNNQIEKQEQKVSDSKARIAKSTAKNPSTKLLDLQVTKLNSLKLEKKNYLEENNIENSDTDLSAILTQAITSTISGLLSVDAKIISVTKLISPDILGECIKVDSRFEFKDLNTSFSYLIPAISGSYIFNTMLGDTSEPDENIDDDTCDAISELCCNMSGSLTTSINSKTDFDLGNITFCLNGTNIVDNSDYIAANIYKFELTLDEKEIAIYIHFEDSFLPYISSLSENNIDQEDDFIGDILDIVDDIEKTVEPKKKTINIENIDLSNAITEELSNTLESLLSVDVKIVDIHKVGNSILSRENFCIMPEFQIDKLKTNFDLIIPARSATKIEYLMLGGISESKLKIDNEVEDVITEVFSFFTKKFTKRLDKNKSIGGVDVSYREPIHIPGKLSPESSINSNIFLINIELNKFKGHIYICFENKFMPFIETFAKIKKAKPSFLSQDEIEALLDIADEDGDFEEIENPDKERRYSIYDFKKPNRISTTQMKA
ncbi:MAG: hypothetical protein U9Q66_02030, partial [Patescibacteria group bacterium]|nr:hypothetical protein [Patescibacteria group bacterium]